jgi:2-amino-4-hydroxy-6-hydroxymethyldihydropteridine diphosphokinase
VSDRRGFLGLGSNVGDRRANLQAAADAIAARRGIRVLASSSVYETEPVGEVLEQPDFLNACIEIETALGPEAILDACKAVEWEVGRTPGGTRHGPRVIDVDVLLLGDLERISERLRLPHEDLENRRFVLVPLAELDPALALPGGRSLKEALESLGDDAEVRLAGPPLELPAPEV